MFQFLIGCVVGLFIAFILFVLVLLTDIHFDMTVATNCVIAFATTVAVIIHYSSIKQQRKDRLWDINKSILLDLSHTLSKAIKAKEYYLQEEYARVKIDDAPNSSDKPNVIVFKDFMKRENMH